MSSAGMIPRTSNTESNAFAIRVKSTESVDEMYAMMNTPLCSTICGK